MSGAALHPSERIGRRVPLWLGAPISALILAAAAMIVALESPAPDVPASRPTPLALPAIASPAVGTTGTAALPPEPAGTPAAVAGAQSARPFSLRPASRIDRARALECLTAAIYYEAASESDDGQRAVAQVVLNRVRHPAFPASVCGVVYQGSDRASGCQFSYACDGSMARVPARAGWTRAARTAALALNGYVYAPVGLATHYHTYAVTPAWNRTLVMTDAVGAHFFHRWKGYWGTAAAFHQVYLGREPTPGPIVRGAPPIPTPPASAVIAASSPVTEHGSIAPARVEVGGAHDSLPESAILDRWKDSGKPLK